MEGYLSSSFPIPMRRTAEAKSSPLPLADLAVGTAGSIIRRGAADWEEYAKGTEGNAYGVLKINKKNEVVFDLCYFDPIHIEDEPEESDT